MADKSELAVTLSEHAESIISEVLEAALVNVLSKQSERTIREMIRYSLESRDGVGVVGKAIQVAIKDIVDKRVKEWLIEKKETIAGLVNAKMEGALKEDYVAQCIANALDGVKLNLSPFKTTHEEEEDE